MKKTRIKPQCDCNTKDVTLYIWITPMGEKHARNIRAPNELWERLEKFKKNRSVKSVNQLIVGLLVKACDEEGV